MATRKRKRGTAARGRDPRLTDIQHAPRERWQHGGDYDVVELDGPVAARRVQRSSGAVDGLRRSGRIGDGEVAAASRWVADYERSLRSSYVDPATAGIRGGGANAGPELRLLGGIDAAIRRQQVREALGADGEALLVTHVHIGMSLKSAVMAASGNMGGTAMGRAADRLAGVLRDLSAHYAEVDRHGARGILQPNKASNDNGSMPA